MKEYLRRCYKNKFSGGIIHSLLRIEPKFYRL
jgi:hypothetical protein